MSNENPYEPPSIITVVRSNSIRFDKAIATSVGVLLVLLCSDGFTRIPNPQVWLVSIALSLICFDRLFSDRLPKWITGRTSVYETNFWGWLILGSISLHLYWSSF